MLYRVTIILLLSLGGIVKSTNVIPKEYEINKIYEINLCQFNECIDHLKYYEGYRETRYTSGKHLYIGYGHQITKGDTLFHLTKIEAQRLLKIDFLKQVKLVYNNTCLTSNKLLAVSLLSYNIGWGKTLSYIKQGLLRDYSKCLAYCNYRIKGVIKYSKRLKERRLFEYNLYQYD